MLEATPGDPPQPPARSGLTDNASSARRVRVGAALFATALIVVWASAWLIDPGLFLPVGLLSLPALIVALAVLFRPRGRLAVAGALLAVTYLLLLATWFSLGGDDETPQQLLGLGALLGLLTSVGAVLWAGRASNRHG